MIRLSFDAAADRLEKMIRAESNGMAHYYVAIDGLSGSGKSTLADELARRLSAFVIRTDDFYLPLRKRTPERTKNPGWNIDFERFTEEVARPFLSKKLPSYGVYNCKIGGIVERVDVPEREVYLIEGSYALHPEIPDFYDLRIVLHEDKEICRRRILEREGEEKLARFDAEWFPLEEEYLSAYMIEEFCDVLISHESDPEEDDGFSGFTLPLSLGGPT